MRGDEQSRGRETAGGRRRVRVVGQPAQPGRTPPRQLFGEADPAHPPRPFTPGSLTSIPSAPDPFVELVERALDELPEEFLRTLDDVPVMVADHGAQVGAYGLYHGASIAHPGVPAQILVFRDTLTRDFGHDPVLLARQVRRVVRHELGHHLGFDEPGVRRLGL